MKKPNKIVTACVTEYGSKLSGYPAGTVLPFDEAKFLPSGKPEQGKLVANWRVTEERLCSMCLNNFTTDKACADCTANFPNCHLGLSYSEDSK